MRNLRLMFYPMTISNQESKIARTSSQGRGGQKMRGERGVELSKRSYEK